jgi:hypothetical protein
VAIYSDDLPKGVSALSRRQENWANLYLNISIGPPESPGTPYRNSPWPEWAQKADSNEIASLIKQMNASLLPIEKMKWIDPKNQRLLLGIERILNAKTTAPHVDTFSYSKYLGLDYESRYDNIMLNLDFWRADLAKKEALIAEVRNTLTSQQLEHAKTKWLDRENHTQLEWALNYLKEHQVFLLNIAPPSTPDEKFAYILGTLDQPGQHHLERKVFLDSMRRAWSQYKYRYTGKSQRQVYFSLGKEARSKLEDAAEHQNRRKSDIVEELILRNL